ncbi:MAG: deoxyribodipyrimidine photo-lyase [Promethearchaeota archaeon]|jgi:deoxyribodipyrimidine photo-lyase
MDNRRIRVISKQKIDGPIVYWMSRDQRMEDNWALIYAQELALTKNQPLIIIFCLQLEFLNAEARMFDFMIDGLEILENNLEQLNIPFLILKGDPRVVVKDFLEKNRIGGLIADFSPLRLKRKWVEELKSELKISFMEIDAHNIVPCWIASDKKEYAAYTLRSKIRKLLPEFLTEFPKIKKHQYIWENHLHDNNWNNLRKSIYANFSKHKLNWIKSGEYEARIALNKFIKGKLKNYTKERNDPNKDGTSNLSPYLHFGQIASQRVVLESSKILELRTLKGSFYDEIIVRKELSDNFCYYCQEYDSFTCFPAWARQSLNKHRNDKREYLYTLEELEKANTHDKLWNAAQVQMLKTGKMHGYLRMYWAKKILEWTESPEKTLEIAIYLNDRYELDGRDPNGYAGIAWSIGGVQDRAWRERDIFGKIRYMSYNGMKRKFNVEEYIDNNLN